MSDDEDDDNVRFSDKLDDDQKESEPKTQSNSIAEMAKSLS